MTSAVKHNGSAGIGVTTTSRTIAPASSGERSTARLAAEEASRKTATIAQEPNTPMAMRAREPTRQAMTVTAAAAMVTTSAIIGKTKRDPAALIETSHQRPTPVARKNA